MTPSTIPGPDGRAALLAMADRWEAEIAALDAPHLGVEDRVTLGLIGVVIRRFRGAHERSLWQMDGIDQYGGPQGLIGQLARLQRVDSEERVDRLRARLAAFPAWIAAHIENTEAGLRAGRTAARPVVQRCITQTRRIVETPVEQSPILVAHPELEPAQRDAIVRDLETLVRPAEAAWLALLERYEPHARDGEGVCHLPDGEGLYRYHVLAHTTLDEDPRSIHEYGLARLDGIEAASRKLAGELGHASIADLRRALDSDPANHATEPDGARPHRRGVHRAHRGRGAALVRASPERPLHGAARRAAHGAGGAAGVLHAALGGRQPQGRLLHQHVRSGLAAPPPARRDDVPRGRARAPLPDRARAGAHGPADVPPLRLATRGRGLRRGLGPLRRGPRVRDGPVPHAAGAFRRGRVRGLAGRAPGRRHRHPRARVDAPAVDRPPARACRALAARGRDRDRPLHQLARPGARVHDRPARDPRPASGPRRRAWERRSTSRRSTTPSSAHGALPLATLREQLPGWLGAGARS